MTLTTPDSSHPLPRALAAAGILTLGLSLACGPSTPEKLEPADATRGAKIYTTYCTACHQADGSGVPTGGVPMAASFSADPTILAKDDARLLRSIRNGTTGRIGSMPGWNGVLSSQDQVDVLAYLRTTFGPPSAGSTEGGTRQAPVTQ